MQTNKGGRQFGGLLNVFQFSSYFTIKVSALNLFKPCENYTMIMGLIIELGRERTFEQETKRNKNWIGDL